MSVLYTLHTYLSGPSGPEHARPVTSQPAVAQEACSRCPQPHEMDGRNEKKEVEAVLQRRQGASARPSQEDLATPYEYLRSTFTSSRNEGSSTSATSAPHWFCSKCPESLHREAATYLVFLFAYAKSDTAQLWLTELEGVLSCEGCARGFGIAKKRFKRK